MPERYDRLRPPYSFQVKRAIPQSRRAILTALYRDTALLKPPHIGILPPSDRHMSGYCLPQTALYRDTDLLRPPYIGIQSYSDRLTSGYRLPQTALYRDTALLRPPYTGIPPYSDRLISGYRLLPRPPYIGIPPYSVPLPRRASEAGEQNGVARCVKLMDGEVGGPHPLGDSKEARKTEI